MGIQIKESTPHWVAIDTEFDMFAESTKFSMEIINASTGDVVANEGTGTFSEIMWTFTPATVTAANASLTGSSMITVADSTGVVVGDRISDGTNIYYVTAVEPTVIYIKGKLVANIADLATIDLVGNTGIYRVDIQLSALGNYFVNFNHPDMGHTSQKIEVVANTVDDVYTRLDDGLNALGANKAMKVIA